MPNEIMIALITVGGTMLSAFFGVIVASKMTNFRLLKLEAKVEVHNNAVTRLTVLETSCVDLCRRVVKIEDKIE